MSRDGHDLGADYHDRIVDSIKREYRDRRDALRADVYADGRPPGHAVRPPHEQLAQLDALRAAGDWRAFTPEAHADRERLLKQVRKGGR